MIKNSRKYDELVDEADAKLDEADLVEESNPELYKKLVEEASDILDTARSYIT